MTHNIMGLFYVQSSVTIWVLFMCYLIWVFFMSTKLVMFMQVVKATISDMRCHEELVDKEVRRMLTNAKSYRHSKV